MIQEDVIFTGSGSERLSLLYWPNTSKCTKPLTVSKFPKGYSVYGLAISPNGTRIAAGTKAGLIRVHGLVDFKAPENAPTVFEVFHQARVTSLAFCTDDILASGGLDGHIKLWSIPEKRVLADMTAHDGGVLALCQMGSLVLASIGGDGLLKLWDLDTLEVRYESAPFNLPRIQAFTSLDYDHDSGLLMHPSRSGDLHVYDVRNDLRKTLIPAHRGDFSALAFGINYLVTAGAEDAAVKLWPPSADRPIAEASAPAPALAAAWAGPETLMTIHVDGSGQIWKLNDGRLLSGPRLAGYDLRSVVGLPTRIVAKCQSAAGRQWRNEKLAAARQIIAQPEKRADLALIIEELYQRDFSAEAVLLLADAAKAQGCVLWELESRLALAEGLGDSKAALPSLYALAVLLQEIKEPRLAIRYFEEILRIDESYSDVGQRIAMLKRDPILRLGPEDGVHADLGHKEQLLRELAKHTILKKKFLWKVVTKSYQPETCNAVLDVNDVGQAVITALRNGCTTVPSAGLTQATLLQNGQLRDLTWAYMPSAETQLPVAIAVEIRKFASYSEVAPYGVFDPKLLNVPSEASVQEHNQRVKQAWIKHADGTEAKRWLAHAKTLAMEGVRQFASAVAAMEDDEF